MKSSGGGGGIEKMEGDLYGHQRSTGTNFHALAFLPGKDEAWQTCSALFYFIFLVSYAFTQGQL